LSDYFNQNFFETSYGKTSWIAFDSKYSSIISKLTEGGVKLKDWKININRGIVTGYNQAFVISTDVKEVLVKMDPKCAQIIRPILRGKDIERYGYNFNDLWLIYIPWHFPLNNKKIINASIEAEAEFKKQYPSVYNHLFQYKENLSKRNKSETGIRYEWYALQRYGAKYMDDFNKQKIIYPNMTKYMPFYLDNDCFMTNQKCFIITGKHLGYLTAFLNSNLFKIAYRDTFPELLGGTRELSKIFFKEVFVKPISDELNQTIESLVQKLQDTLKREGKSESVKTLESEINAILYNIYNLNDNEIDIVEKYTI
jgi:hypothetical protein